MYSGISQPKHVLGDKMTAMETSVYYFDGKLSAYTVRDLWRRGELPGVKCGGRLIFSREELERWFRDRSWANVESRQTPEYGKIRPAVEKQK